MFIASSYWRGVMNVKDMRGFKTETEAIDYVKSLSACKLHGFEPSFARVYEIFDNKPPRLVKLTK